MILYAVDRVDMLCIFLCIICVGRFVCLCPCVCVCVCVCVHVCALYMSYINKANN